MVAIIAILAAILFPVFSSARKRAAHTSCLSNMRQIVFATQQYLDDHRGLFPNNLGPRFRPSQIADVGLPRDDPSDPDSNRWDMGPVRSALTSYVNEPAAWYCPASGSEVAEKVENSPSKLATEDHEGYGVSSDYQANAYVFVNSIPRVTVAGVVLNRPKSGIVGQNDIVNPSKLRLFQDFWNQGRGVHFSGVNAARADGSVQWQRTVFGITNVAWWAP